MCAKRRFNLLEAKQIGDALGIDWQLFGVEQFQMGLEVELEHGARDVQTNVTNDDALITGKIALAHLKEFPDYYTRLSAMEKEADEYWANGYSPAPRKSRRWTRRIYVISTNDPGKSHRIFQVRRSNLVIGRRAESGSQGR